MKYFVETNENLSGNANSIRLLASDKIYVDNCQPRAPASEDDPRLAE
jgi:hypothetical protein